MQAFVEVFPEQFPVAAKAFGIGVSDPQVGQRPVASYFTKSWTVELIAFVVVPFILWLGYKLFQGIKLKVSSPIGYIGSALQQDRKRFITAVSCDNNTAL